MLNKLMNSFSSFSVKENKDTNEKGKATTGKIIKIKDPNCTKEEEKKDVVSVVITICSETSYDTLFQQLPQQSEYGRISVYLVHMGSILEDIHKILKSDKRKLNPDSKTEEMLQMLKKDCYEAGADACCFNFECCSGFNDSHGFSAVSSLRDQLMCLVAFLVRDFGAMTMFSDFSLKALITNWNADILKFPCPFENVGSFSGDLELGFDPETLKNSPSAQLNTVGSLSEGGKCHLHALGGTIKYTLSQDGVKMMNEGKVEVLTVATKTGNENANANAARRLENENAESKYICEINSKKGLAGHVLVKFPPSKRNLKKYKEDVKEEKNAKAMAKKKGKTIENEHELDTQLIQGMILTSCGHWIELMKIDVNMERLLLTVQNEWGASDAKYAEMNDRYCAMDSGLQEESAKQEAVGYLQSRAPAKFNQRKMRMKKKGY